MKYDPKDVTIEKGWLGMGKGNALKAVHWPTNTILHRDVPLEVPLPAAMRELIRELKSVIEKIEESK